MLPVYVDTYLNKNNIVLITRFCISKCACAKIDELDHNSIGSIFSLETVPILDIHGLTLLNEFYTN